MPTSTEDPPVAEPHLITALQNWVSDPLNQFATPQEPQLILPLAEDSPQYAILTERLEDNLKLADSLIRSRQPDLRFSSSLLFNPIVAAGGGAELESICDADDGGRQLWLAFIRATELFFEFRHAAMQARATQTATTPNNQKAASLSTVIVHGTWASGADWWREVPGSNNFWNYINGITGDCIRQGKEFRWSGGLTDADRRQGANLFLNWWQQMGRPNMRIIAHSHGANVVLYAATLEPRLIIDSFILLGAPICIGYPFRINQTKKIANVYSENDAVQPNGARLAGARGEGRTVTDSNIVANYHVPYWDPKNWGVKAVGHSDLHEEDVWVGNKLGQLL